MRDTAVERELIENDIYTLKNYLNDYACLGEKYITYPLLNPTAYTDLAIREGFFNYSLFGYGKFEENNLIALVLYNLPLPTCRLNSATLVFSVIDEELNAKELLLNSIKSLNDIGIKKVKASILQDTDSLNLSNFLLDVGFVQEIKLKDELGLNKNLQVFSYFSK